MYVLSKPKTVVLSKPKSVVLSKPKTVADLSAAEQRGSHLAPISSVTVCGARLWWIWISRDEHCRILPPPLSAEAEVLRTE